MVNQHNDSTIGLVYAYPLSSQFPLPVPIAGHTIADSHAAKIPVRLIAWYNPATTLLFYLRSRPFPDS